MANKIFGIQGRNEGQLEAIKALADPEISLVVLEGIAGSGKTLLAIAAGLGQVLDKKRYREIIFTRSPVSLSANMGFLPGTEEEKMLPWLGALEDNLEAVLGTSYMNEKEKGATGFFLQGKIKVKAIQFMRGRSFIDKYIILDEAQNLTSHEVKVLLTRIGEGSKIVVMGDASQIDHPKLTTKDNGLALLVKALKDHPVKFAAYINLPKGERSELANYIAEVL